MRLVGVVCIGMQEDSLSDRQIEIKRLVEESGAVTHGHFRLASGKHSDTYIEKFRILERPSLLEKVCGSIVDHFRAANPGLVAGPSTGGMIVAYEAARQLGVPAIYIELDSDKRRTLRRGGHIEPGTKVLLVDDVLTTGISLRETAAVISSAGGALVGVGVLIDRSDVPIDFGCDLHAACRFSAVAYDEDAVPEWLARIPLTTPGTRAG